MVFFAWRYATAANKSSRSSGGWPQPLVPTILQRVLTMVPAPLRHSILNMVSTLSPARPNVNLQHTNVEIRQSIRCQTNSRFLRPVCCRCPRMENERDSKRLPPWPKKDVPSQKSTSSPSWPSTAASLPSPSFRDGCRQGRLASPSVMPQPVTSPSEMISNRISMFESQCIRFTRKYLKTQHEREKKRKRESNSV